jgi:hypothetical protein
MRLARSGFGADHWSGHGAVPCADYEGRAGPPERRRPGTGIERINERIDERTSLLSAGPAQ